MESVTQVLATTSEISLKGGNRPWFERRLTDNVRSALSDLPVDSVQRPAWRVLITFSKEVPFTEVARRLSTVFGLNSMMPVSHGGHTVEQLESALGPSVDSLTASSFAIRCLRSDKRFPMTSPEIEREIGRFVQERTGWRVDLRDPDVKVHLLLDENGFFFWWRKVPGPGGLPVGVSGRALCMISGGIDSPVAAFRMMKRGMQLDFVHFHSMPRTDPASLDKVRELVAVLNRYQGPSRLAMVPLLEIQNRVVAHCPAELRVLLYRRFMLRIAERIARRFDNQALVTGESLGQVSSQTIENLAAVEAVVSLPILRPLIGFDKQEIIRSARRLGSYEISIEPHTDCCSYLLPLSPATRSSARELGEAESGLDIETLVTAAVDAADIARLADVVGWEGIPVPVGVAG
jgi:thiamine biosynthesis protein ThiI